MADNFSPEGRRREANTPAQTPQAQPARVAETKSTRRRRDDSGESLNRKLYIPERFKNSTEFAYRWVNDDGARIQEKTRFDDWDIVHQSDLGDGYKQEAARDLSEGTEIRRQVGKQDGRPIYAYLCRKPLEYHKEDQAKKKADIDALEETMRRGPLPSPNGLGANEGYVPSGHRNVIERG